jgi:RecB family exonuclease
MSLDAIKSGRATTVNDATRNEQHDELRLLHKAVGAASEKLIVTAVDAEEEQISPFIRILLTKIPDTETNYNLPRITLRGMVGELRRRLVQSTDTHERLGLAFALARLAVEGAPGASPRDWYGLLGASTEEPLVITDGDEAGQVWLHPSQLEAFLTCPLHWFLNSNGGSDSTFEASLGTLMHSVLEAEEGRDEAELWQILEDKWHTLPFEAGWLDAREKRRAKRMFGAMMQYLRDTAAAGTTVLGREVDFRFEYNGAIINGTVDRIEKKADGSIVIVDLKTSKTATSAEETLLHPQLGLYQLAFLNGAFNHVDGIDATSRLDGAKLLFTGDGKVALRDQPSLEQDQTVRDAIEEMVAKASTEMAMPQLYFEAQVGSHCTDKFAYGSCKLHLTKAVTYVG